MWANDVIYVGGTPAGLTPLQIRLPAGHWIEERAAIDLLTLASKGRSSRSLDTLTTRQGGQHVLCGAALALAATTQTWAQQTRTRPRELVHNIVR